VRLEERFGTELGGPGVIADGDHVRPTDSEVRDRARSLKLVELATTSRIPAAWADGTD
jgi:hypothetical protein